MSSFRRLRIPRHDLVGFITTLVAGLVLPLVALAVLHLVAWLNGG